MNTKRGPLRYVTEYLERQVPAMLCGIACLLACLLYNALH